MQIENKIIPFPSIEDVFQNNFEKNKLVFIPLCSINLSLVDSSLNDWVHFVHVWDTGNYEANYFSEHRGQDWIKFQLNDNKYQYLGNTESFPMYSSLSSWLNEAEQEFKENREDYISCKTFEQYISGDKKKRDDNRRETIFEHYLYVAHVISFLITKENYFKTLRFVQAKYYTDGYVYMENKLLDKIGGKVKWTQSDATPKDENGNPLIFVGELSGCNYLNYGIDAIYLFYDKYKKETIQIFQCT